MLVWAQTMIKHNTSDDKKRIPTGIFREHRCRNHTEPQECRANDIV